MGAAHERSGSCQPDRLFPTIFKGEAGIPRDDEAFAIWTQLVPASRITELGLAENFWQMGDTGPCGRCSEILYFRGNEIPCPEPVCLGIECDCERYVEVWNNVFMEFDRSADGTLTPLPAPSIDTGMGLERITSVIQGKLSNYDTDLFTPILAAIGGAAGRDVHGRHRPGRSSRRLDARDRRPLRAMTFLIADGVLPSNEWRGYVLRKIMRRAMRHGKKLGLTEPVPVRPWSSRGRARLGGAYPELRAEREAIAETVRGRGRPVRRGAHGRAAETRGADRIERRPRAPRSCRATTCSGCTTRSAFRWISSRTSPAQRGLSIDRAALRRRPWSRQRERARAAASSRCQPSMQVAGGAAPEGGALTDSFEGYTTDVDRRRRGAALYRLTGDKWVPQQTLDRGEIGAVVLDRTPFYVESGGQVSDTGELRANGFSAAVQDVKRPAPGAARRTSSPSTKAA